jgi:hypothetical protein
VLAVFVSTPSETEVARSKFASPAVARPDRVSDPVHGTDTLSACPTDWLGTSQSTEGSVLSIFSVTESLVEPPTLWAEHEDVVPLVSDVKL